MKHRVALPISAIVCLLFLSVPEVPAAVPLPDEQHERLAAAFMLALGRAPTSEEAAHWAPQHHQRKISELITQLRAQLAADPAMQRAVIARACHDVFGRAPTDAELRAWSDDKSAQTYTERMQRLLRGMRERPAEFERVIQRAYAHVVRRDAYEEEITYWKERGGILTITHNFLAYER